jgi:hypothetical protein
MEENYTVDAVLKHPLNTLSEKQIRNKLRELKTIYPKLIKGGNGFGRGFKYSFHNSLFDLVTERKYNTNNPEYLKTRRNKTIKDSENKRNEMTFFNTDWKYITGLNPSIEIKPEKLKETIKDPNLNIFYSIHYHYDNNLTGIKSHHIHWVFDIKNDSFDLKTYRKRLENNEEFERIVQVPEEFDKYRTQNCFDYFIGNWYNNNLKQSVIEYGTL